MMRLYSLAAIFVLTLATSSALAQKNLNNFVTELVNIQVAEADSYQVTVDRDTWLFVRVTSEHAVRVKFDDLADDLPTPEAMRFVAAGKHTVTIDQPVDRLEMRTIAEIGYSSFPYHPLLYQMGPYDWDFLEQHINPNITTMIGSRNRDQRQYALPWRASGKRWVVEIHAPG